MNGPPTSNLTDDELRERLLRSIATVRALRREWRSLIARIVELEGWELMRPSVLGPMLRIFYDIEVSEEDLWHVAADRVIDAAYPRRDCAERIALWPVAREAMEASTP